VLDLDDQYLEHFKVHDPGTQCESGFIEIFSLREQGSNLCYHFATLDEDMANSWLTALKIDSHDHPDAVSSPRDWLFVWKEDCTMAEVFDSNVDAVVQEESVIIPEKWQSSWLVPVGHPDAWIVPSLELLLPRPFSPTSHKCLLTPDLLVDGAPRRDEVCAQHAEVELLGNSATVTALDGTIGLAPRGRRAPADVLAPGQSTTLRDGDVIFLLAPGAQDQQEGPSQPAYPLVFTTSPKGPSPRGQGASCSLIMPTEDSAIEVTIPQAGRTSASPDNWQKIGRLSLQINDAALSREHVGVVAEVCDREFDDLDDDSAARRVDSTTVRVKVLGKKSSLFKKRDQLATDATCGQATRDDSPVAMTNGDTLYLLTDPLRHGLVLVFGLNADTFTQHKSPVPKPAKERKEPKTRNFF
jgi:hypothetical protein